MSQDAAPKVTSERGTDAGSGTDDAKSTPLKAAVWVYFSLLIAMLAAIGIQGDVLQRLIRGVPLEFTIAIILTIVGAALPVVMLPWIGQRWAKWIAAGGAVLSLAGLSFALYLGTGSITEREAPSLDVDMSRIDESHVHIKAHAQAFSLRATDAMLLRIARIEGTSTNPRADCTRRQVINQRSDLGTIDGPGTIVAYLETGPAPTGIADTVWESDIDLAGSRYLCAYAILTTRPGSSTGPTKLQSVTVFVDTAAIPVPSPLPTPTQSSLSD